MRALICNAFLYTTNPQFVDHSEAQVKSQESRNVCLLLCSSFKINLKSVRMCDFSLKSYNLLIHPPIYHYRQSCWKTIFQEFHPNHFLIGNMVTMEKKPESWTKSHPFSRAQMASSSKLYKQSLNFSIDTIFKWVIWRWPLK